jgi:hypothetical protein
MSNKTQKEINMKRAGKKAASTRSHNREIALANLQGKHRVAAAHKAWITMEHRKIDAMPVDQLFS